MNWQSVSFDFERDPVSEIERLYGALKLPNFGELKPRLETYVQSLAGYRKNEHAPLDKASRQKVARAWARSFERWNYAI